jgi:murein DD-endopeptidase MepM/ murein hydrolase activator NlpD
VWGGSQPEVNYHVRFPDQRWAYDLIVRRDGMRHRGRGDTLEDYYVYDLPVVAPAAGIVHSAVDGEPDKPIGGRWRGGNPAGKYIGLEVTPNQYLFMGHLKPGSVKVKSGDTVRTGQEVGHVGNSGRTPVPHLHIHLQDSPTLGFGEGIPLYFYNYRFGGRVIERGIPTGGEVEQVVENEPSWWQAE